MSKTMTKQQQQQQQNQNNHLVLKARKKPEEYKEITDTEEFYMGVFQDMRNQLDEMEDNEFEAMAKADAYQKAYADLEQEAAAKFNDLQSKLKLADQKIKRYEEKEINKDVQRQSITNSLYELYDAKDRKREKMREETFNKYYSQIRNGKRPF